MVRVDDDESLEGFRVEEVEGNGNALVPLFSFPMTPFWGGVAIYFCLLTANLKLDLLVWVPL